MRIAIWMGAGVLLLALGLLVTWGLGLPPLTWIEKSRFATKADAALATVSVPVVPPGIDGDTFVYSDGWIVMLYGQSRTTGHNLWNYNLAKDSSGGEYVSERHFCTAIRKRYDMRKASDEYYLKSNPDATSVPNPHDPEFDEIKSLVEARSLADATSTLIALGFTKR